MPRKQVSSRSGSDRRCIANSIPPKLAFRTGGRRAGQRFDAQHGVTTEALIFLSTLDPEVVGPALDFATHYEPTPVREAERLLDAVPVPLDGTTFVDVGSGMGRVVLLAARRPFKTVVGVEVSGALHEIARENVARFERDELRCRDVRLVRKDAAEYKFPRGKLALYLYNPFRGPVLETVLEHVLAQPREVTLLYHTPAERDVVERTRAFELLEDFGFAAVYRRL